ncbi:MAG: TolC family protein [Oligoflexales bacterium]|nr:TolC family protein [Oligoflexales bacterium]
MNKIVRAIKRTLFLPLIFLARFPGTFAETAESTKILTFEEALNRALTSSYEIQRSTISSEQAKLDLSIADYKSDPRLTLEGTLSDQSSSGPGAKPESNGKSQNYAATLSYDLWDFGRHSAEHQKAEKLSSASRTAEDEVKDQIFWQVARAYLSVLSAIRVDRVASGQVELAELKLKEQKQNYEKGLRPESDVVSAEVDLGKSRLASQKALDDLRISKLQLRLLMNGNLPSSHSDMHEKFSLPDNLVREMKLEEFESLHNKLISQEKQSSPSTKRRAYQKEAISAEKLSIEATKRPTLGMKLSAKDGGSLEENRVMTQVYTAELQLSWTIPWNGMSKDEYQKMVLQEKDVELQDQIENKSRSSREKVALKQIKISRTQWEILNKQRDLLEKQKTLIRKRYETGKATTFEVSQNEMDILNLKLDQIRLYNSMLGYLLDIAEARSIKDLKPILF